MTPKNKKNKKINCKSYCYPLPLRIPQWHYNSLQSKSKLFSIA